MGEGGTQSSKVHKLALNDVSVSTVSPKIIGLFLLNSQNSKVTANNVRPLRSAEVHRQPLGITLEMKSSYCLQLQICRSQISNDQQYIRPSHRLTIPCDEN